MKKLSIILALFAMIALASCGTQKDRCPSVGEHQTETVDSVNV
jgi:hypothetical protein